MKEIEAELEQFCSDLAKYFEDTVTYDEVKNLVNDDVDGGPKSLGELLRRYQAEGTQDSRDYETILSAVKQTTLSVTVLEYLIDKGTDEELDDCISRVEDHFVDTISYRGILGVIGTLKERSAARQEARQKGGDAKARVSREIKGELARLLRDKQPQTGWGGKAEAARLLTDSVAQFQQVYPEKNRLDPDGIQDRITRWLYEDKSLKKTYNEVNSG